MLKAILIVTAVSSLDPSSPPSSDTPYYPFDSITECEAFLVSLVKPGDVLQKIWSGKLVVTEKWGFSTYYKQCVVYQTR